MYSIEGCRRSRERDSNEKEEAGTFVFAGIDENMAAVLPTPASFCGRLGARLAREREGKVGRARGLFIGARMARIKGLNWTETRGENLGRKWRGCGRGVEDG